MRIPLLEKTYVTAIGALLLTAGFIACMGNYTEVGGSFAHADDGVSVGSGDGMDINSGSYEGIPSTDPDDGKFVLIAGGGHETVSGTKVIAYIGLEDGVTSFEIGIFDGEIGDHWDFLGDAETRFTLYMDPLKNGTTSNIVTTWLCTSSLCPDDDWYDQNFTVHSDAQAPSGNYFYRLVAEWDGGTPDSGLNDFKIRTTGQISLAAGSQFGFAGGPQNLGYDPGFGPENTYDGYWCYNFYVPIETNRVVFQDGDADHRYDTDDPNSPPPEGDSDGNPPDDNYLDWGDDVRVTPNIYIVVTDPDGNTYNNPNPSGNGEWEIFSIGDQSDDDYVVNYMLSPGLWEYDVNGMDAHNANFLQTTYEIFVCGATPPLPVNPPPEMEPDHTEDVSGGMTYYYDHTVTNRGVTQTFDLSGESNLGWLAGIYEDTNGNGVHEPGEPEVDRTPNLGTNETYYVLAAVDVPSGPPGETDIITLTASSRIEWAVQDTATDDISILGNNPPVPDAGGPYLADEGDTIVFDASGSYDPDGDSLEYRWDFEGDGVWDTPWSPSPHASLTVGDDCNATAILEVTDGDLSATDTADWTVHNVEPSIGPFGPFTISEGSPISLTVTGTDPGSDDLTFEWELELGPSLTSIYYNDGIGPDPYPSPGGTFPFTASDTATHTYGDNGIFALKLTVTDDDGGTLVATTEITVLNVAPSGSIGGTYSGDEGSSITFTAQATDPGSDDLTFTWEFELGPTITNIYYNDGVGPDPYPSPGGTFPFTATDAVTYTYGDNGVYTLKLTVTDDDGGSVTLTTTVTVNNLAPSVSLAGAFAVDEGTPLTLDATATDPGSDDLTFDWEFELGPTITNIYYNDGVGPDPYPSPGGTFPFTVTDTATHTYGDNGDFTVKLTVSDDDGLSTTVTTTVTVYNLPPTIAPFGPLTVDEGSPLTLVGTATDPGSDDLTFEWEFELGPSFTSIYYNDGVGPDPYPSPGGTFPFTVSDSVTHTYGDNGAYVVKLTVTDDDGLSVTVESTITVNNVAPAVTLEAYVYLNFTLRVAGEKWHDVEMHILEDGSAIGYARVVRFPGNPDDQSVTLSRVKCHVDKEISVRVLYTPFDDPINGQVNGANPVWVFIQFENGTLLELHHTFGVQHPETWEWNVGVNQYLAGHEITLEATATDPGSDDLTFIWVWGDGSPDESATYYNDGVGPDPAKSPWGTFPFTALDARTHIYTTPGSYTLKLGVEDDDGGLTELMVAIILI